jgi:hypothetical protein
MPAWLAALIVAVVVAIAAGIAALLGKKKVAKAAPPVPTEPRRRQLQPRKYPGISGIRGSVFLAGP